MPYKVPISTFPGLKKEKGMEVSKGKKGRNNGGFRRVEIILPEDRINECEKYIYPLSLNTFAAHATLKELNRIEGMDREAKARKDGALKKAVREEIIEMIKSGELKG